MARQKIHLDSKNIYKLTKTLSFSEQGVFFSLLRFFFGSGDNYFCMNIDGVKLTKETLLQHLVAENVAEPSHMLNRFLDQKIFALRDNFIIFPELERQQRVSKNKIRNKFPSLLQGGDTGVVKKPHIPKSANQSVNHSAIQSLNHSSIEPSSTPIEQAKQDVLFHINIEKADQPQKTEKEIKLKNDSEEVLRYLNEKSGKAIGFQVNKSNLTYIISRLKEGATIEQCKMVIDKKVLDWKGRGQSYDNNINPKTLFRPSADRFPTYLNEATAYFKAKENEKPHDLNTYIKKNHPRVSNMVKQMTYDECEKIAAYAADTELIKLKLRDMENDAFLFKYNDVYLSLRHRIENHKKYNKTETVLKSGVK